MNTLQALNGSKDRSCRVWNSETSLLADNCVFHGEAHHCDQSGLIAAPSPQALTFTLIVDGSILEF